MQTALVIAPSAVADVTTPTKNLASTIPWRTSSIPFPRSLRTASLRSKLLSKANPTNSDTSSTVDYSSINSVFPVEACDTVGGEACDAEMYPEVKLKPEARNHTNAVPSEQVDREYFEYNSPKTVFPAEACDDLGGDFCQPDYQKGVY